MRYSDARQAENRAFISRHLGPDTQETQQMLDSLGLPDIDTLINQTIPQAIRMEAALNLPSPLSEDSLLDHMADLAAQNKPMTSLIGEGYYGTITPPVLLRNILENPGWYTAYTPYQAEISQGRLEALLNFQTMICELTNLDMANASLLDEATAAAEAMAVARRASKSPSDVFFVESDCHPQTLAVLRTRAEPLGWQVVTGTADEATSTDCFGVLFSYPGSSGQVRDLSAQIAALRQNGSFIVMACDILSLAMLTPPGDLGADMAIGSTQRFGVPMGFGGPHAAFMATSDAHKRLLPGRIIGVSVDQQGLPAYRLSLQTREQHIRREKATSNICTAQALLAIMASMYAIWHGPDGLRRIAGRVHMLTALCADGLARAGIMASSSCFDTLEIPYDHPEKLMQSARNSGYNFRQRTDGVCISFDETSSRQTVEDVWAIFGIKADFEQLDKDRDGAFSLPSELLRDDQPLRHPIFSRYKSETDMMRYLRRLSDRDLALDRSMIPLGSCTMKLNAAAEMIPISWEGFANMHPFCPPDQARGYHYMINRLCEQLCEITGYDAVSMQPNSGAQGEYAGLMAIRGYLNDRGETDRTICLIPSSAHGTNPASAQMAGFQVVVVACDDDGNISLTDLDAKLTQHEGRIAAIMVTYPSTHGVFEEDITTICHKVHDAGGQVYLDGANLNAQVGLARPGKYGADVSHLNLHKTFCIPHGGGGPGMGPIGVKSHLAPYLAGHSHSENQATATGQISAAPFGSPLILPISYSYIMMMGADGLKAASEIAILNANYIAEALADDYPVLYRGAEGRIAHEVIIDIRPLKASAGIDAEDIAKRLMDYGFHAPTMSFPVAGTLMIEPTESESKAELDRFISAMKQIREEIRQVESGHWPQDDNPLKHAPHTASYLTSEDWQHPYSRAVACFPAPSQAQAKYWPASARIDNVYGDRNLICVCPPLSDYQEAAE